MSRLMHRLGALCVRRKWIVVAAWVVVVLARRRRRLPLRPRDHQRHHPPRHRLPGLGRHAARGVPAAAERRQPHRLPRRERQAHRPRQQEGDRGRPHGHRGDARDLQRLQPVRARRRGVHERGRADGGGAGAAQPRLGPAGQGGREQDHGRGADRGAGGDPGGGGRRDRRPPGRDHRPQAARSSAWPRRWSSWRSPSGRSLPPACR